MEDKHRKRKLEGNLLRIINQSSPISHRVEVAEMEAYIDLFRASEILLARPSDANNLIELHKAVRKCEPYLYEES